MRIFLLIFSSIILSNAFTYIDILEPKLCDNCKFCIKENILMLSEFSKCRKFKYIEHDYFFETRLNKPKRIKNHFCSTARKFDYMCGEEGKKFEKKINKNKNKN
jgi:hypothetical protein